MAGHTSTPEPIEGADPQLYNADLALRFWEEVEDAGGEGSEK